MNATRLSAGAILPLLLSCAFAHAQAPMELPFSASPSPKSLPAPAIVTEEAARPIAPPVQAYAPDAWVYQQQPDCCPTGLSGPIGTEIYARGGASFPIAGSDFKKALRTGWEGMAGGRSLFFSADGMRAWIVDLGVSYTINDGKPSQTFLFQNGQPVTLRDLHRTAVSLGIGHDWFINGPGPTAAFPGNNFRFGIDGGARLGTAHLDLNSTTDPNIYAREHDVYGAAFVGVHAGWEIPMGDWTLLAGGRAEWSYSYLNLLPNQNTSLHDINVLLTLGVRW